MVETLRELTEEMIELQMIMSDEEADPQVVNDTMESVMLDFKDKLDDYGTVIRNLEGHTELIASEIKRLQSKKKNIENNIDRMKKRMIECMESIGEKRSEGTLFTFSIRNNPASLPKEIPLEKVPFDCWRTKEPEIDRKKLLKAVKSGRVEGIELVSSKSLLM